ncbi:AraC family transcriptional regulator [Nonomuraea antri]|uniref:AraC family transcriptional regulator n=1 Tax=Nonomuraea antri TaxID=2730852 RepID=UPI001C2C2EC5|nr:AraC family transcriptional regulator [Nonomuraea antri]
MTAENLTIPATELTIVGHYDKTPGYVTRRRTGASSWLLLWTQAGGGLVEQAGVSLTTKPGDLVVLKSGMPQHYRVAAERWRFWWVHFQPRPPWLAWLGAYALAPGCHLVGGVPESLHDRVDLAFRRALSDASWLPGVAGPPPGAPDAPAVAVTAPARELVLGAVEEVLILATASARRDGEDGGDERIGRVLALIAAQPGAPHSVASLARAAALSPSRLAHLFTAETGQTPMQAVRDARVRHAAGLLEVTDMDIAHVAAASGFVSPFHFSRAFKKHYGLPPRDYRTRLRGA